MTRKKKCNSESNSFIATAEQVCLQPVLEHRQRRGRRNIAWQAFLTFAPAAGMTQPPIVDRNIKLFSGGGPEPASVQHVGATRVNDDASIRRYRVHIMDADADYCYKRSGVVCD